MKNLILLLAITLICSCCNNDDDNNEPTNPIDQLPPATQTGANTAGCLVNGEAFLPNNQSVQPLVCHYLDGEDFALGVSKKVNNIYYNIYIYIGNTELQVNQTYQLMEYGGDSKFGEYIINHESYPSPNYYSTSSTITGELTITHHDFNNAFLSGTFWFDALNSDGEIIEVREGRFDMHY
ncbi:MAG TPA: DUF6252 family protein [Xanthomarina sp.]|nr:DUF6252 family protein [Xanthomarina sp.]